MDAHFTVLESRLPLNSKQGSELTNADLVERFTIARVPWSDIRWTHGNGSALIKQSLCVVTRTVIRLARLYRWGYVLEISYIQPQVRMLLRKLCKLLLNNAELCLEKAYKTKVYHIHGKMDSGVCRLNSNVCFLSEESKRADQKLKDKDICQAAGEVAGCVELLKEGLSMNPLLFYGILTSGKEWIFLRRALVDSQPVWQYTTALCLFDNHGVVDKQSLLSLTKMLMHCFANAQHLIQLSQQDLKFGYGMEDIDTVHDDDEEDYDDGEEEKKKARSNRKNDTQTKRGVPKISPGGSGKSGSSGKGRGKQNAENKERKERKFGTVLTESVLQQHNSIQYLE
jgi:hypothetical protein